MNLSQAARASEMLPYVDVGGNPSVANVVLPSLSVATKWRSRPVPLSSSSHVPESCASWVNGVYGDPPSG